MRTFSFIRDSNPYAPFRGLVFSVSHDLYHRVSQSCKGTVAWNRFGHFGRYWNEGKGLKIIFHLGHNLPKKKIAVFFLSLITTGKCVEWKAAL